MIGAAEEEDDRQQRIEDDDRLEGEVDAWPQRIGAPVEIRQRRCHAEIDVVCQHQDQDGAEEHAVLALAAVEQQGTAEDQRQRDQ